jgi:hypothetical protein
MRVVPHPAFPSMMILGPRVDLGVATLPPDPGGAPGKPDRAKIEQVLVAIVKGTFPAEPPPADPAAAVGIFVTDEPSGPPPPRYEHDLATFKPRADIVVLGPPAEPPPAERPPGGALLPPWTETVSVPGDGAMQQPFGPADAARPFTFGWQLRTSDERRPHAGSFGPPVFDPADVLPVGFSNLFFNGGDYRGGSQPVFRHLAPGAVVEVSTRATYLVGLGTQTVTSTRRLRLPATAPTATLTVRDDHGATVRVPLAMAADTVVYDKTTGHFAVTWRGVAAYDHARRDRYLALELGEGV